MPATNAPRVYGYIRWSTDRQTEGDSLKRQQELIDAYVERHDLILHELLIDKAHSAEDGSNITRGKLGHFIANARAGKVPPNSKLLVEHEDRITRQTVSKATRIVGELVEDFKITIVYLSPPEREVTPDNINDIGGFISTAVRHSQANTEVVLKNNRIRKSWGRRKTNASPTSPVTAMTPGWLKALRDERGTPISYEVDEERAKIVKQIFQWSADGYGVNRIAKELLKEKGYLPFGKSITTKKKLTAGKVPKTLWHPSTVAKLLTSRSVIGEYQPGKRVKRDGKSSKVKEDSKPKLIYPPIITPKLFKLVGEKLKGRRQRGGSQGGHYANLFGQILRCAYCGGQMKYRFNTPRSIYLRCATHSNGYECESTGWRYGDFEKSFLSFIYVLNLGRRLTEGYADPVDRDELADEIDTHESEIKDLEAKREETYATRELSQSASTREFLAQKLDEISTKIEELKVEVETKKEAAQHETVREQAFKMGRDQLKPLIERMQARKRDTDLYDLRLKFASTLTTLVVKIYIASVGTKRTIAPTDPNLPPLDITHPDVERFFIVQFPHLFAQQFVAPSADDPIEGRWGAAIEDRFFSTYDTREGPPRVLGPPSSNFERDAEARE